MQRVSLKTVVSRIYSLEVKVITSLPKLKEIGGYVSIKVQFTYWSGRFESFFIYSTNLVGPTNTEVPVSTIPFSIS